MDETRTMTGIQGQSRLHSNLEDNLLVALQVNPADSTGRTILHQLKLTALALIIHRTIVIQINKIVLTFQFLHQRQDGGIVATTWFIDLKHLPVLDDDLGL